MGRVEPVNPPKCPGCGKVVYGAALNSASERIWHGECWLQHLSDAADTDLPGVIGQSNHDERITDGLELP